VVSTPYNEFTYCGAPSNQNILLPIFAQRNLEDNLGLVRPKIMFNHQYIPSLCN
jgi:hypothetical protein